MSEVAFPVLGGVFVALVLLPTLALLARLLLEAVDGFAGPFRLLGLRYVILVGASLLPLAWLISAGVHQAERPSSVLACLLDHGPAAWCAEPGLFAAALAALVTFATIRVLRRQIQAHPFGVVKSGPMRERLDELLSAHPLLGPLVSRVVLVADPNFTIGATGLFRPRILLGARFAAQLSDAMLVSALGHEAEHLGAWDPLRYLALEFALALNPIGRLLLDAQAGRWLREREAECDRQAVRRGADPLALADAIVCAARPLASTPAALSDGDIAFVRFRVRRLLEFSEREMRATRSERATSAPLALGLVLVAMLLPHKTGTLPLDMLHSGAERALSLLVR